jgi:hypothetical protein
MRVIGRRRGNDGRDGTREGLGCDGHGELKENFWNWHARSMKADSHTLHLELVPLCFLLPCPDVYNIQQVLPPSSVSCPYISSQLMSHLIAQCDDECAAQSSSSSSAPTASSSERSSTATGAPLFASVAFATGTGASLSSSSSSSSSPFSTSS